MKILLTILTIILFSWAVTAQKGTTYVRVGYKSLVGNEFEKIVGKKYIDWKDGTVAGKYYIVEYDYGEPPPDYIELTRSYLTHGFPDTIRGWVVSDTGRLSISGDCFYESFDLIERCINKVNSRLPMYIERMSISIPGCSGNSEFSIKIRTTEEEYKRRDAEILKLLKKQ
jgi:hypothetical protein